MTQVSSTTSAAQLDQTDTAAPKAPPLPPLPPPSPSSGQSQLNPETKAKIAAIYAEAQSEHKTQGQIQREIDIVLAESPSSSSNSSDPVNALVDTSA